MIVITRACFSVHVGGSTALGSPWLSQDYHFAIHLKEVLLFLSVSINHVLHFIFNKLSLFTFFGYYCTTFWILYDLAWHEVSIGLAVPTAYPEPPTTARCRQTDSMRSLVIWPFESDVNQWPVDSVNIGNLHQGNESRLPNRNGNGFQGCKQDWRGWVDIAYRRFKDESCGVRRAFTVVSGELQGGFRWVPEAFHSVSEGFYGVPQAVRCAAHLWVLQTFQVLGGRFEKCFLAFQGVSEHFKQVLLGCTGSQVNFIKVLGGFPKRLKAFECVRRRCSRFQNNFRGLHKLSGQFHGDFRGDFKSVLRYCSEFQDIFGCFRRFQRAFWRLL